MNGGGFASAMSFFFAWFPSMRMPLSWQLPAFALGTLLVILGSLFRRHCWKMLGTSFTGDVRATADQEVVSRGAYKYLRHPSYTAGIILNTGVGIALGSWFSAIVMLVQSFVFYIYRMNIEERVLLRTIGEPYRQFMATRKRLIPGIY